MKDLDKIGKDAEEGVGVNNTNNPTIGMGGNDDFSTMDFYRQRTNTGSPSNRHVFPNQSKYRDYVAPIMGQDQDFHRARAQSTWAQAGGFVTQAVVGEILGGTLEGFGSIYQLGADLAKEAQGEDATFNNWLMDVGKGLRDWSKEATPIYRENPNKAGDVSDPGWWFQHATSIASSFGLMIPGIAAVKGVGAVGKLLNIGTKLGQGARGLLGAAGMASVMRNGENFKEALQVIERLKPELSKKFRDPKDFEAYLRTPEGQGVAKTLIGLGRPVDKENVSTYIASQAGWRSYQMNAVNIISDFVQVLPMFNYAASLTRAGLFKPHSMDVLKYQSTKALSEPIKQAGNKALFKNTAGMINAYTRPGTVMFETITEGMEEIVNAISEKEGLRYGHYLMDKLNHKEGKGFSTRLGDYLSDGHTWEQGFWGAMGGLSFAGGARGIAKMKGIDNTKVLNARAKAEIDNRTIETAKLEKSVEARLLSDSLPYSKDDSGEYVDTNIEDIAKSEDTTIESIKTEEARQLAIATAGNLARHATSARTVDLLIEDLQKGRLNKTLTSLADQAKIPPAALKELSPENMIKHIEAYEATYRKEHNSIFGRRYSKPWMKDVVLGNVMKANDDIYRAEEGIKLLDNKIREDSDITIINENKKKDPTLESRVDRFGKIVALNYFEDALAKAKKDNDKVSEKKIGIIIDGLKSDIKESIGLDELDNVKANEKYNKAVSLHWKQEQNYLQSKGYAASTLQKVISKEGFRQTIIGAKLDISTYNSKDFEKESTENLESAAKEFDKLNKLVIDQYFDGMTTTLDIGTAENNLQKHIDILKKQELIPDGQQTVDTGVYSNYIEQQYNKANKRINDAQKQKKKTDEVIDNIDPNVWSFFESNKELLESDKAEILQDIADKVKAGEDLSSKQAAIKLVYEAEINKLVTPKAPEVTTLNKDNEPQVNLNIVFNAIPKSMLVELAEVIYNKNKPNDIELAWVAARLFKKYLTSKDRVKSAKANRKPATILKELNKLIHSESEIKVKDIAYLVREYIIADELAEEEFSPIGSFMDSKGNHLYGQDTFTDYDAQDKTNESAVDETFDNEDDVSAITEQNYIVDKLVNVYGVKVYSYHKGTLVADGFHKDLLALAKKAQDKIENGEELTTDGGEYLARELMKIIDHSINSSLLETGTDIQIRLATSKNEAEEGANADYRYNADKGENMSSNKDGALRYEVEYTEEQKEDILNDLRFRLLRHSKGKYRNSNLFIRDSITYDNSAKLIDELITEFKGLVKDFDESGSKIGIKRIKQHLFEIYYGLADDYTAKDLSIIKPAFSKLTRRDTNAKDIISHLTTWSNNLKNNNTTTGALREHIKKQLDNKTPINKIALDGITLKYKGSMKPNYAVGVENSLEDVFGKVDRNNIVIVGKSNVREIRTRGENAVPIVSNKPFQQGVYMIIPVGNNGKPQAIRLHTKKLTGNPVLNDVYSKFITELASVNLNDDSSIISVSRKLESIFKSIAFIDTSRGETYKPGIRLNINKSKSGRVDIIEIVTNTSTAKYNMTKDAVVGRDVSIKQDIIKVTLAPDGSIIIRTGKNKQLAKINLNEEENDIARFKAELLRAMGNMPTVVDFSKFQNITDNNTDEVQAELIDSIYDSIVTNIVPVDLGNGKSTIYDIHARNQHRNVSYRLSFDNLHESKEVADWYNVNNPNSKRNKSSDTVVIKDPPVKKIDDKENKGSIFRNTLMDLTSNGILKEITNDKHETVGSLFDKMYGDKYKDSMYGALIEKYKDIKLVNGKMLYSDVEGLQYDPMFNEITIHNKIYSLEHNTNYDNIMLSLVIHELVHAEINSKSDDTVDNVHLELQKIKDHLIANEETVRSIGKSLNINKVGLDAILDPDSSVEELITYTFSDSRFMDLMASIKMDFNYDKSLLDQFMDIVKSVLAKLGVTNTTALHNLTAIIKLNNIEIFGEFKTEPTLSANDTRASRRKQTRRGIDGSAGSRMNGLINTVEVDSSIETTLTQEEKDEICVGVRNVKAARGFRNGLGDGKWKLEKDLAGYKPHSKGGVDLKIDNGSVSILRGNSSIKAEHGLFIAAEGVVIPPDGTEEIVNPDTTTNPESTPDVVNVSGQPDSELGKVVEGERTSIREDDKEFNEYRNERKIFTKTKDNKGDDLFLGQQLDEVEIDGGSLAKARANKLNKEVGYWTNALSRPVVGAVEAIVRTPAAAATELVKSVTQDADTPEVERADAKRIIPDAWKELFGWEEDKKMSTLSDSKLGAGEVGADGIRHAPSVGDAEGVINTAKAVGQNTWNATLDIFGDPLTYVTVGAAKAATLSESVFRSAIRKGTASTDDISKFVAKKLAAEMKRTGKQLTSAEMAKLNGQITLKAERLVNRVRADVNAYSMSDKPKVPKIGSIAEADAKAATTQFDAASDIKLQKTIEGINNNTNIPDKIKSRLIENATLKAEGIHTKKLNIAKNKNVKTKNVKGNVDTRYTPKPTIYNNNSQLTIKVADPSNKKGIISLADKKGSIEIDDVLKLIAKDNVSVMDRHTMERVLKGSKPGETIQFEDFQVLLHDDLARFNTTLSKKHAEYGLDNLGYDTESYNSYDNMFNHMTDEELNIYIKRQGTHALDYKRGIAEMEQKFKDGIIKTEDELKEATALYRSGLANTEEKIKNFRKFKYNDYDIVDNQSLLYHSSDLGTGSSKHYESAPLAHSRYITTKDDPSTFTILESQSDYYQGAGDQLNDMYKAKEAAEFKLATFEDIKKGKIIKGGGVANADVYESTVNGKIKYTNKKYADKKHKLNQDKLNTANDDISKFEKTGQQKTDIGPNIEDRLLQTNTEYAANLKMKKMRYPTAETLANIEGYPKTNRLDLDKLAEVFPDKVSTIRSNNSSIKKGLSQNNKDNIRMDTDIREFGDKYKGANKLSGSHNEIRTQLKDKYGDDAVNDFDIIHNQQNTNYTNKRIRHLEQREFEAEQNEFFKTVEDNKGYYSDLYSDSHAGIIKKYKKLPSKIKRLLKEEVTIVKDKHGNTWYEFNIPDSYKAGKAVIRAGSMAGVVTSVANQLNKKDNE